MTTPAPPSPDEDDEVVIDPLTQRANLYQTLTAIWCFPSLGAALILGTSAIQGTLQTMNRSPRIEDLAAILMLASHVAFAIQSRRFRRLNLEAKGSNVNQTVVD